MTASEHNKPFNELKKALDEFGLSYDEEELKVCFSLDVPGAPKGLVNFSFTTSKEGRYVHAQAFSPGATLPHEKLQEAFQYANLWNAHRSFSRILVDNFKEPDRDLLFVADATFYVNAPYEPRSLRAFLFERFLPSAVEFFETIGKSLRQTDPTKENER